MFPGTTKDWTNIFLSAWMSPRGTTDGECSKDFLEGGVDSSGMMMKGKDDCRFDRRYLCIVYIEKDGGLVRASKAM